MGPRVRTSCGTLVGRDEGTLVFRGIPFAAPPVGPLRWRPPQPAQPWSGERDAGAFGGSAMQRPASAAIGSLIGIPTDEVSEDCLYLNVWTPGLEGRRPVLVWIHGGGNMVGSGSQPRIDGTHLARRGDVVVVTLNYRLGAFGFLHAPELGATGNEAPLDQVAALRWVRREIASFGGDPANVTVFGQSAGGFDIVQLMGLPIARELFDRAVPMSGSLTPQLSRERASEMTARLAEPFGDLSTLRDVPAQEILQRQGELTVGPDAGRFGPVRDGEVIVEDAVLPLGRGTHTRGLPLLIGTARDESSLFTVPGGALDGLDDAGLAQLARRLFGTRAPQAIEIYRKERDGLGLGTSPLEVLIAMQTDRTFRIPALHTAELHSAHTPHTWMYLFDYESPALDGRLGACHSLDIPFVWGTYGIESMRGFCGTSPVVATLSEKMMDLYLAFARSGQPATPALPDWPRYDVSSRATMHLGERCWIEKAPMDATRALSAVPLDSRTTTASRA